MHIKFVCRTCGDKVDALLEFTSKDEITAMIDVCDNCFDVKPNTEPIKMYYGDLLEMLQKARVEVHYYKKDGDFRVLVGFLGLVHETNERLVYFVEKDTEDAEPQVKCLLKKNIASIRDLDDNSAEYHIYGGVYS